MEYRLIKYPLSIQDGLQKSKMAATIFRFFFYISTSDRGDFPRIIEIALFVYLFIFYCIGHQANIYDSRFIHELMVEFNKRHGKQITANVCTHQQVIYTDRIRTSLLSVTDVSNLWISRQIPPLALCRLLTNKIITSYSSVYSKCHLQNSST